MMHIFALLYDCLYFYYSKANISCHAIYAFYRHYYTCGHFSVQNARAFSLFCHKMIDAIFTPTLHNTISSFASGHYADFE